MSLTMALEGPQDWTIKLLTAFALLTLDTLYGYQSYWSTTTILAVLPVCS